jgi:hypothetical protein
MSDPVRLFEGSDSALERQLLGVARAEKSSPDARTKTLMALGLTGSAALSATAVGAAAARASVAAGKTIWAKLALGLSVAGVVAVAPPVYRAWQRHQAADAFATAARTAAMAAPWETPAPTAVAPEAGARGSDQGATPVAPATLARELVAVDAARTAVARRQPRRALALLDAYARSFPGARAHLGPEAEILRIDALAQSGHPVAARAHAEAFIRLHPGSVLSDRARRYLAD